MKRFLGFLKECVSGIGRSHRRRAVELTACEVRELENLFMVLLAGSMTGLPSPPPFVASELLPALRHELEVLNARAQTAPDALAELSGMLGID